MPYVRFTANIEGKSRHDELHGRPHRVVPTAMLAEGVWQGSGGPVYYPNSELESSVLAWNHKPVVVYHPKVGGNFVSACDPVVLNTRQIGVILKTKFDDKLRTETWIDVERANAVDGRVLEAVDGGQRIECSTGLQTENEIKDGEFKGTKYSAIARNYRPDHLAILPDAIGAYSVKDGGGLLANERFEPQRNQQIHRRSIEAALKSIGVSLTDNELAYSQISSQLTDLLASKFGEPGKYWPGYVIDCYPDRVIFYSDGKLQSIGYSVKDNTVSLEGDASEVTRVIEYQTQNGSYSVNASGLLIFNRKEEPGMAFDKKKHVDSLIGNGWEETDRVALEGLADGVLQKITPVKKETPPPDPPPPDPKKKATKVIKNAKKEEEVEGTEEENVEEEEKETPAKVTLEELLNQTDPDTRDHFNRIKQGAKRERESLVASLVGNENCAFSEAYIKDPKRSLEELRGLAKMAARETPSEREGSILRDEYLSNMGPPDREIKETPLVMPELYPAKK